MMDKTENSLGMLGDVLQRTRELAFKLQRYLTESDRIR
jgi:hypothetical protein